MQFNKCWIVKGILKNKIASRDATRDKSATKKKAALSKGKVT